MTTLIRQKTVNRVVLINTELISPNRNQPRKIFDVKDLQGLAQSVAVNGVLQPITVRKTDGGYELVAGERRLRAAKLADIKAIPCIVMDLSDRQSAIFALLENLQRTDLNYFEEGVALKNLIVEWGVSQTELGQRLGKAQSTIANKLRLLQYSDDVQEMLVGNNISERQARALLQITDQSKLPEAIEYIAANKFSCLQTERYVAAIEQAREIPKKTFKPVVRDVRIFFNTINNAIKLMNDSGINAIAQKIQCDDYIEYVVKIPLNNSNSPK